MSTNYERKAEDRRGRHNNSFKRGDYGTPLYLVWQNVLRIRKEKRVIPVPEEWHDYMIFKGFALSAGYVEGARISTSPLVEARTIFNTCFVYGTDIVLNYRCPKCGHEFVRPERMGCSCPDPACGGQGVNIQAEVEARARAIRLERRRENRKDPKKNPARVKKATNAPFYKAERDSSARVPRHIQKDMSRAEAHLQQFERTGVPVWNIDPACGSNHNHQVDFLRGW